MYLSFKIVPRLISSNRVTIPKEVIDNLNAREGDYLEIEVIRLVKGPAMEVIR